jgi:hypothetical protein
MAIKHGTVDAKRYLGTTEIGKVYLGTTVVLGSGSAPSAFDSTAFNAESNDVGYAVAFCELYADGSALVSGNVVSSPATPRWWSSSPPATWVSFSSTGNGIRVGGLTAGVRYEINTTRQLGIEWDTIGARARTFTMSFYDAASGGNLLGTKTFTASVEVV